MIRIAAATIIAATLMGAATAQTLNPESGEPKNVPQAPSMSSSATTMAPVKAGSSQMHEVPTPSVSSKATATEMGTQPTTSRN